MGFPGQTISIYSPNYWSGLPFPSPGDIPGPGIEPRSLALQADALPSEIPEKQVQNILRALLINTTY